MKSSCFLSVLLVLCAAAVGQRREYMYSPFSVNRTNAQKYCREKFTDLAMVTSEEENARMILPIMNTSMFGWFGLQRSGPLSKRWQFSDGESATFLNWSTGQPSNGTNEDCANAGPTGWNDQDCSVLLPFFCYKRLILVKENKTWEEALRFCRSTYTGLANLISKTQLDAAKTEIFQNQSVGMWTGLRFLDGKWFWLNHEPVRSDVSVPQCPAQPFHCGARNFGTNAWENRDCNEKLYFLCF